MAWTISYTPKALKQLRALDRPLADRIERYFTERVAAGDPYTFSTELVGQRFAGQRRFRVGDYRIICELIDRELMISVVRLGHRKEVYD